MRSGVAVLAILLLGISDSSFAISEWIWHKTQNGRHPNDGEQQQIWLINRARANPGAEGRRLANSNEPEIAHGREHLNVDIAKLRADFRKIAAKPPVAHDVRLYQAARAHSQAQIARSTQDHVGQLERVDAAGFFWTQFRGNVFSYAYNDLHAHAAFNIDWGEPGSPYGMQDPPQHRKGIMSVDGDFTNVGIASRYDTRTTNTVGPYVVTQNFAKAAETVGQHHNSFIVGTVWSDNNRNGRYDPGEGLRNVTVMPSTGDYYALTAQGGGYAIPSTHQGSVTVYFAGADVPYYAKTIKAGPTSVLVDYEVTTALRIERDEAEQSALRLFRNSPTTDKFGYGFGRSTHRDRVVAEFQNPGVDSFLTVRGYDIDRRREVGVYVNGELLGHLNVTEDGKVGGVTQFFLKTSELRQNNRVEFRQRAPGEVWGIYQIALLDDRPASTWLTTDVSDSGRYGSIGGNGSGTTRLIAKFANNGRDLMLVARGQNIFDGRHVEVKLNGASIGWMLPATNPTRTRRTRFSVPASILAAGVNTIEFQARSAQWAVSDIIIRDAQGPVIPLKPGQVDAGAYGWLSGTGEHRTVLRTAFTSDSRGLTLSFDTIASARDSSIRVYLNGSHVGNAQGAASTGPTRLTLDASLVTQGRNEIEFRRSSGFGTPWGVTNLLVSD